MTQALYAHMNKKKLYNEKEKKKSLYVTDKLGLTNPQSSEKPNSIQILRER
jgi:hypothetical protein